MTDPTHPEAVRRAMYEEMICRELSPGPIAKAARERGYRVSLSRVQEVLSGATPNPGIRTVLAVLAGLGRDLAWLAREVPLHSAELYARDRAGPTPDDVPL